MKKDNPLLYQKKAFIKGFLAFVFVLGVISVSQAQCSGHNLDLGTICSNLQFETQSFTASHANLGEVTFTLSENLTQVSTVSISICSAETSESVVLVGGKNTPNVYPGIGTTICWEDLQLQAGESYNVNIRFTYQ